MSDVLEGPFGESAGGQGWAALLLLLAIVLAYFVIRWVAERYYARQDRRHPWVSSLDDQTKG